MEHADQLRFVRDALTPAERAGFYSAVANRQLHLVARGVGVPTALWLSLDSAARHRLLIAAVTATTSQRLVLSHHSAAMIWRLPWLGPLPPKVAATAPGGRSTTAIAVHRDDLETYTLRDAVKVTTLERTVVDVARAFSFETAVVVADAVLAGRPAEEGATLTAADPGLLAAELARVPLRHGSAKARMAVGFADPDAGSPGESVSRVSMWRAGFPAPELQKRFPSRTHAYWAVDFWWREFGIIGEFDGRGKYTREELLGGQSTADSLLEEKRREDELRALPEVRGFVRWGWDVALSPLRLAEYLQRAGLPRQVRRSSTERTNIPAH